MGLNHEDTKARSKYKPYPSYKDSGIEWLGQVPEHWGVSKFKFLGDAIIGLTYSPDDIVDEKEGTIVLRSTNLQNSKVSLHNNVAVSKSIPKKLITRLDDILICSRNGSRALIGKNAKIDSESKNMSFGAFTTVFRSKNHHYLYWVLNSSLFDYQSGTFLTTTINQLTTGNLNSFETPLPSMEEQTSIANFLDQETGKMDLLIEKQQAMISLLKEKRQAVISHAVTKGVPNPNRPNAPMKDSGIKWLGQIPEGWDAYRINNLFSESNRRAESSNELGYPILSVSIHSGISDKELNTSELDRKVTRSEDKSLYKVVHANYLVYNMMRAWQGGFGASNLSGLVSPAYVVCKPLISLNSDYFELVLRTNAAITELKRFSKGITDFRLRLYWDEFKNIKVPFPSKAEQDEILLYISEKTQKIDILIEKSQQAITLLKERKTALISAAVTGKIDLR